MNKMLFLFIAIFLCLAANSQRPATVKQYNRAFVTYPFSDPDPIPSFTKIYPYFRFDGYTDKPIQKEWKVVELENDYIKLMILPQIGGKIWAAVEKSTGRPFIYYNHAVKFRDVAMRGPWTSGGIEANYGIIGHTPNCATPVDYLTRVNKDGSASCIIGVLDLLTRTNWRIEITVPRDKAYFTTKSFWYNSSPLEQPYYHWMNVGLKAGGNLEFIYPGTHYLGHDGEYAEWPVNKANGKNISFYEQNNFGGYKSYHVFGRYANFFGGYWHNDDIGIGRYATHDDKAGKKIWIWGLSRQGMIWEKLLTDSDGQYVEVQSGRLFNQNAEKSTFTPFKHRSFAPYATDEWTEYWYPVLHTRGFVEANEYGALNVRYEGGWLKIYFSPVQALKDKLEIKEGDRVVYQKTLSLRPLKTFSDSVKVNTDPQKLTVTIGGNKVVYRADPGAGTLARPKESPADFDWGSAYGLYLQGKEFMDQKMYGQAEEKLNAALKKDPNFLPALVKMAALLYRNMRYTEALELASRALSIDAHDGAANYFYGIINERLNRTTDAKDGFDLAALSSEYRSPAYTELSRLYLKGKNYSRAIEFAAKAIDFNRYNISAYEVQAVAYRYRNEKLKAKQVLDLLLSFDPLNHFARFEKYIGDASEINKTAFASHIQNELPQETYLELAVSYFNKGCVEEAARVLQLSPGNAITHYWRAFLQYKKGADFSTELRIANQAKPDLVFPFRSETADVLQWALKQSDHWKPRYFLALIYKDRNRTAESMALLHQSNPTADYAPLYAARALLSEKSGPEQVKADLMKALSLNREEWRYHKLLTEYFIKQQQYPEALDIAGDFYHANPGSYIMGMLYAKTLLLNKKYTACDQLLSKLNVIPFEGATEGRELYREAKLMQAVQHLKSREFTKALQLIAAARDWPENLGVGKPYEEDVDERLEDWIGYLCYQQSGKLKEAESLLQKIARFRPRVENTVRNYIPANNLVTLWALEKLRDKQQAANWLSEQSHSYPDDKKLSWVKAVYYKQKNELAANEKDATVRIIEQLMATE